VEVIIVAMAVIGVALFERVRRQREGRGRDGIPASAAPKQAS
jgi:hypothetical protein